MRVRNAQLFYRHSALCQRMAGRDEILSGMVISDLALWIPKQKVLAIADPHIGYEEALNRQGVLVPREQFRNTVRRLQPILEAHKPETIVVNGDLKHEFGRISDQEWKEVLKLLDLIARHCTHIVLVEGNHDTVLGPLAGKRNLEVCKSFTAGDVLFVHGDAVPGEKLLKSIKTIVIGHEHPCLGLRDGERIETFKCWLLGRWKRRNLIVMPSFNLVTEGSDILKEKQLSPLLQQGLDEFSAYIVDESSKVLPFGKVKNLR